MAGITLECLMLHALKLLRFTEMALEVGPCFIHCRFGVPFLAFQEVDSCFEHLVVGDVKDGGNGVWVTSSVRILLHPFDFIDEHFEGSVRIPGHFEFGHVALKLSGCNLSVGRHQVIEQLWESPVRTPHMLRLEGPQVDRFNRRDELGLEGLGTAALWDPSRALISTADAFLGMVG